MFTIKEFCHGEFLMHVSECKRYTVSPIKSPAGYDVIEVRAMDERNGEIVHRVGAKHRERIVVENAAGKTVTNLHYNAESGHCTGI